MVGLISAVETGAVEVIICGRVKIDLEIIKDDHPNPQGVRQLYAACQEKEKSNARFWSGFHKTLINRQQASIEILVFA